MDYSPFSCSGTIRSTKSLIDARLRRYEDGMSTVKAFIARGIEGVDWSNVSPEIKRAIEQRDAFLIQLIEVML